MGLNYFDSKEILENKGIIKEALDRPNYFVRKGMVEELVNEEEKESRILEIGCGQGNLYNKLINKGYNHISLVDIDNYTDGLVVQKVDVSFNALPFSENSFDLVLAIAIIEHLENPFFSIREIYRVLRPGGKLIVAIPSVLSFKSRIRFLLSGNVVGFNKENNHISFFSEDIFTKIVLNKFDLKKEFYSDGYLKLFNRKFIFNHPVWNKQFGDKVLLVLEKI